MYDEGKFNQFSNGAARKLSNVEFSALMVHAPPHPPLPPLPPPTPSPPLPPTQVLKVGPFHQHYQTLSARHAARGDITAALIALERGADRHPRWGCGYHAQSCMCLHPPPPPTPPAACALLFASRPFAHPPPLPKGTKALGGWRRRATR